MGKLFIIGTPIGNLSDMTPRAIEAIRSCSRLLCEDTRHTRKLLSHFGIWVTVESFHEHNEQTKTARAIDALLAGETIGLVSDAGMPLLSDPGFTLVRAARQHKIDVEPIPGPVAAIVALAASGIPPVPFTFYGFAPHRSGERRDFYRTIASARTTAVVYEAPERLLQSLLDAQKELGNVPVTVAREMTKLHEEFLHGTLREVIDTLAERDRIRGEITIVFGAASQAAEPVSPRALRAEFQRLRQGGLPRNDAIKLLSEHFKLKRNELYRMLLDESD